MPRPRSAPDVPEQKIRRFRRVVKLLAALSLVIAAIAVILIAVGDEGVHIQVMIATALGVGFAVFLATGLTSLFFLRSSSVHDGGTAKAQEPQDQ